MGEYAKREKDFDMKKSLKGISGVFRLFGVGRMMAFIILFTTAVNAVNAWFGYMTELAGGLWVGLTVGSSMCYMIAAAAVSTIFAQNYKLIYTMPMQASTVPAQMVGVVDLTSFACMALDVIAMLATGYRQEILLKVCMHVMLYIVAQLVLYIFTRSSFRAGSNARNIVYAVLGFTGYMAGAIIYSTGMTILEEQPDFCRENLTWLIIALGVLGIAAAVVTELVYKGVRNCVRQTKLYKVKKKKNELEASYV
ncbi:MAG: hypothetical protein IJ496_11135 [Ruminococcus sp.]|nr:hypothetical protein [Ruminococcus sp.]